MPDNLYGSSNSYWRSAICQEKFGRDKFPPTFWAFCQVADIAKLEQMISQAESVDSETAQLILEPTIKDCDSIIDRWLERLGVGVIQTSCYDICLTERSDSAAVKCKERDNGECILTRFPGPNVDIYPSCLLAASAREPRAVERFWDIMNVFWNKDRVQRWKTEIFGDEKDLRKPRHGCFNLLSLGWQARMRWCEGRFALRPMENADSRTLKVQFLYQKGLSNAFDEVDLLTTIPESPRGRYDSRGRDLVRIISKYKDSEEPELEAIASGDVLTVTTSDPETMPLPGWALLEIQWYLR
ncbi:hypothetical protein BDV35DRAFT_393889 [Aspergillus flavus]|uniref:HNH nuclease domain-containing protein n=1 Tax=Aspergillus flavus TaxID=5059 RepID=A0A5N6GU04_ASPFL|nr:hypothetical protein BDV35DRAFT_393889 [Aspergillus flavus]